MHTNVCDCVDNNLKNSQRYSSLFTQSELNNLELLISN